MERIEYLEILAQAYEKRGGQQEAADLARADSELMIPVVNAMREVEARGYRRGMADAAKHMR